MFSIKIVDTKKLLKDRITGGTQERSKKVKPKIGKLSFLYKTV